MLIFDRLATSGLHSRDMASHAVGIDIIEIDRVREVLRKHPERFLTRVFTPEEVAFCRGRVPELAARPSVRRRSGSTRSTSP